jgi:truncated hemoglobin YjbI
VTESRYEHAGGDDALHRLEELFYEKAHHAAVVLGPDYALKALGIVAVGIPGVAMYR